VILIGCRVVVSEPTSCTPTFNQIFQF
jgi:hypothetical protein